MELTDLSKDVRRFLLDHWTPEEIKSHLSDPEYFFEHVVVSRINYLRLQGEKVPRLRLKKTPQGTLQVILNL